MTSDKPASEPLKQEGMMAIPPYKSREYNQVSFQRKVANQIKDSGLSQDQIDQQFDICCLYCVFAFQKEGQRPFRKKTAFKNRLIRRDIINVKGWD